MAYKPKKHKKFLIELHAKHKHSNALLLETEDMPKNGAVAYSSTEYIAMGFLRLIEGGYAQIDTLVSNPDCSPEVRHEGISLLISALINRAKELKVKAIISYTKDLGTRVRAEAIGFEVAQDQSVIVLKLS